MKSLNEQQAEFEARQREIEALNQQILNVFPAGKSNEEELAPVLENYVPQDNTTVTKPVLMSEDEALGTLQNPNATEEDILTARKTLSSTFKAPVLENNSGALNTTALNNVDQNTAGNPVLETNDNGFIPMVVNEGTSSATVVLFNPETNQVRPDGSATSNLLLSGNAKGQQRLILKLKDMYRNNNLGKPLNDIEKKITDESNRFDAAEGRSTERGPILDNIVALKEEQRRLLSGLDTKGNSFPKPEDLVNAVSAPYEQAQYGLDYNEAGFNGGPPAQPTPVLENDALGLAPKELVGSGRGEYGMPTEPMPTEARLDPYMEIPKSDAPAGYHRMDDGTLMSDSDMPPEGGLSEGVLSDGATKVAINKPILMDDNTNQANSRSFSASSANARGSSMPYDKIGRNEMLMRAGGRIMANSDLGLNKALGAGMDEYGQIQDANRANEIAKFNQDETTRLAEARMAAAKAKADAKNNKPVSPESLRYGQAALASINSIQSSLDNDTSKNIFDSMNIFDNATGIFGNLLKSVPTTEAHSVMLNIETIEAAVAFDRLQAMRNASKTGGALGQVSNIELRLLSSSLGNLKQSNNKEEFQRNLDQVKKVYNEIVHGKDYQDPSDVINPTTNNDALYNEADAIIG